MSSSAIRLTREKGEPSGHGIIRAANYVLILTALLLMSVVIHQYGFILLGLCICSFHYFLQKLGLSFVIPSWLSSVIAFASLLTAFFLFGQSKGVGLVALLAFLILVQTLMLFRPCRKREQRLVQLCALFELAEIAVMTTHVMFVPAFLAFLFAFCFHMVVFEIYLAGTYRVEQGGTGSAALKLPPVAAVIWSVLGLSVIICALTVVLFILLPRFKTGLRRGLIDPTASRMIGFSELVKLGDTGKLVGSEEIVMQLTVPPQRFKRLSVGIPELLVRGRVLDVYSGGEWSVEEASKRLPFVKRRHKSHGKPVHLPSFAGSINRKYADYFTVLPYEVYLEPLDSKALFVVNRANVIMLPYDTAFTVDLINDEVSLYKQRRDPIRYSVVSSVLTYRYDLFKQTEVARSLPPIYYSLPEELKEPLAAQLRKISGFDEMRPIEKVQAIERYLKYHGGYTYTLDRPDMGEGDPVIAFLSSVKKGHCEYFASSMTLLCRAAGIPARLAVGFKGGEFGPEIQGITIRQKDAHAWTEVCLSGVGWVSFDPSSPFSAPDDKSELARNFSLLDLEDLGSYVQDKWYGHVIGYDHQSQRRILISLLKRVGEVFQSVKAMILRMIPERQTFWSLYVPIGLVIATALGMLCYWGIGRLERRLLLGRSWRYHQKATTKFYNEVLKVLAKKGLRRSDSWTPLEFFERVTASSSFRDTEHISVKKGLLFATNLYYDVRYGGRMITEADIEETKRVLRLLSRWKPELETQ